MRKKNVGDILQNYFDAQNLNFLEHLEQQDLNLQNHFKMLENFFSSDNDSRQIEQKLKIEKNNLENKINSDNIKFKNKLEQQKAKTNKKLSGTNVYIPDNNHTGSINHNQNRIRVRNNRNRNNNEEKDKVMEYKYE